MVRMQQVWLEKWNGWWSMVVVGTMMVAYPHAYLSGSVEPSVKMETWSLGLKLVMLMPLLVVDLRCVGVG